jgi:hypothetical protein
MVIIGEYNMSSIAYSAYPLGSSIFTFQWLTASFVTVTNWNRQTNGPELASASTEWYKVSFWNCTNPEEFLNGTEIPNFVEVGPFVYRYVSRKFNFIWGHDSEGHKTIEYVISCVSPLYILHYILI